MSAQQSIRHAVGHNIIVRLAAYYVGLAVVTTGVWRVLPPSVRSVVRDSMPSLTALSPAPDGATVLFTPGATAEAVGGSTRLAVAAAIVVAFVLSVPVAWTYMWTRRTRGYRQSVVHSLVLLPVVVAGVVVLVKSSLALAFSLAGIVAAVRFRNTLDDSKDAVFIFFATALGLAAAVQVDAAAVMSVLFIVIVLTLWYSDFARLPPGLEDARAQRQLERAITIANRTGEFVARVDREVLQAMAPAQLDALADRVRRRRAESDDDGTHTPGASETGVRILVTNVASARPSIEAVMERHCKQWSLTGQHSAGQGQSSLEYTVTLRKQRSPAELAAALQKEAGPHVVRAESYATIES